MFSNLSKCSSGVEGGGEARATLWPSGHSHLQPAHCRRAPGVSRVGCGSFAADLTSPVCGQCEPNKSLAGYGELFEFSLLASQTQEAWAPWSFGPERAPSVQEFPVTEDSGFPYRSILGRTVGVTSQYSRVTHLGVVTRWPVKVSGESAVTTRAQGEGLGPGAGGGQGRKERN